MADNPEDCRDLVYLFWAKLCESLFLLAGISYGQRSLVSYSPWGHKRVEYDLATKQQQIKMDFLNVQGTPRRVEK